MTSDDDTGPSLIGEAIDRQLRLRAAPEDRALAREAQTWQAQSGAHRAAWTLAERTWQLMGEVPPRHSAAWTSARKRPVAAERRAMAGRGWFIAVGLVLAVLAAATYPEAMLHWHADHRTATAEIRTLALLDGSVATLGAASALAAEMPDGTRHVTLLEGEAFFDVVPDPDRPFVVEAAGVEVRVIGTAFTVDLSPGGTGIAVERGAVEVAYDAGPEMSRRRLVAGQTMRIDRATGEAETGSVALTEVGAWRQGRLFVDGATIGSVVERLRRFSKAWISLPDRVLASERVTGLYDLRDPDRALRALVEPHAGPSARSRPISESCRASDPGAVARLAGFRNVRKIVATVKKIGEPVVSGRQTHPQWG